ncbi:hypothetical protein NQ318_016928 [Aromia moschata]|uniref:Core Histone H2A/H2B/H3 domain-containing protein n=1 Tax=Aromia moschata TaxID=1265417 RepID=A0AAV8XRK1_9CUCU|nr:hypothetical protein NQ318_016928 [Aromia moschata]
MVQIKSIPQKCSVSSGKRNDPKTLNRMYKIGNNNFKVSLKTSKTRKLQRSTELCIPRFPLSKLIREILMETGTANHRIQIEALLALQEAAEKYLICLFKDANCCAHHAGRVTVKPSDIRLVLDIKGCSNPGFSVRQSYSLVIND